MAQTPPDMVAWQEAEAVRRARLAELLAETDAARRAVGPAAPREIIRYTAPHSATWDIGNQVIQLREGVRIDIASAAGDAAFLIDDLAELREMLEWYRRAVKGRSAETGVPGK